MVALALIVMVPMFAKVKGYKIRYTSANRGTVVGAAELTISGSKTMYALDAKSEDPRMTLKKPEQRTYTDFEALETYSLATLPNGELVSKKTPFKLGDNFENTDKTAKILGYNCKCLHTVINSNHYDVWYTTELPVRGTPQVGVGVPDGLVLKVVRNGNIVEEATSIATQNKPADFWPANWGKQTNSFDYYYTIKQSVVTTVPIFDQERICFNGAKLPEGALEADKGYRGGGGTIIIKKGKWPE